MPWRELSVWWVDEVSTDTAYESVVTPLLLDLFSPVAGNLYLDLGSGEGRVIRTLSQMGMSVIGVDLNEGLAAQSGGPIAVAEIPPIPFRDDALDGVYSVLTLEHIPNLVGMFEEVARITRAGGVLLSLSTIQSGQPHNRLRSLTPMVRLSGVPGTTFPADLAIFPPEIPQ